MLFAFKRAGFCSRLPTGARILKHSCRQGTSEFGGLKSRAVDGTGLGPASSPVLRRSRRSVLVKPGSRFRLQSSIESKTNAGAVQ